MGNFNSIVFPAPKSNYTSEEVNDPKSLFSTSYKFCEEDHIFFFESPNINSDSKISKFNVPCLFLPSLSRSTLLTTDRFLLYFHGNAEDIGYAYDFGNDLRSHLNLNVILMEYPGYGSYKYAEPSAEQLTQDAKTFMQYLINQGRIKPQNILLFGRSMGSGPASLLASEFPEVGGLILMSAYSSIQDVAKSLVGSFISGIVNDRFNNKECMKRVTCPVLLVHGQADSLIKFQHSQLLESTLKNSNNRYCISHYPKNMTHNQFGMKKDILDQIDLFMVTFHEKLSHFANLSNKDFQTRLEDFRFRETTEFISKINLYSSSLEINPYSPSQFQTFSGSRDEMDSFSEDEIISQLQSFVREYKKDTRTQIPIWTQHYKQLQHEFGSQVEKFPPCFLYFDLGVFDIFKINKKNQYKIASSRDSQPYYLKFFPDNQLELIRNRYFDLSNQELLQNCPYILGVDKILVFPTTSAYYHIPVYAFVEENLQMQIEELQKGAKLPFSIKNLINNICDAFTYLTKEAKSNSFYFSLNFEPESILFDGQKYLISELTLKQNQQDVESFQELIKQETGKYLIKFLEMLRSIPPQFNNQNSSGESQQQQQQQYQEFLVQYETQINDKKFNFTQLKQLSNIYLF